MKMCKITGGLPVDKLDSWTDGVKVIHTGGCYDCGGACKLKVHVKDGVAIRVESDDGDEPQLRACARGRAYRKQVYSPERLRYPMKRVGPRGQGQFQRISWDEALDTVAGELLRIKETYGARAIWGHTYSAQAGTTLGVGVHSLRRFLELFGTDGDITLDYNYQTPGAQGAYTSIWGNASAGGGFFGSQTTYGTPRTGNDREELLNSRFILIWGCDPATTIGGTNTCYYLAKAKEAGARIVVVDPRYTTTAAVFADQWIPIKPCTDAAMMIAMAYVMITAGIHDKQFLDRYTVGFEKFKDYVMGKVDGIPKTPAWAEARTGVPSDVIATLARDYATIEPAAITAGWAPGRTAYGEQYHRLASTLAAMTGNVGISGGDSGGVNRGTLGPPHHQEMPDDLPKEMHVMALNSEVVDGIFPHICQIWDAILHGAAGGYPCDIKMAYIIVANPLNQFPNINKGVKALKKLDFIVVHDHFMTATARYADILLPVTTNWEREDFCHSWNIGPWFIYQNKAIQPLYETRTDWDIIRDVAKRLDIIDPLLEMTEEDAIRHIVQNMNDYQDVRETILDLEVLKKTGIHKVKREKSRVAFRKQIEDPDNNPFPTLSGKIEIYSKMIADINNPELPAIPKYMKPWEGPEDPLIERFPLQLITIHPKLKNHSIFENNSWLQELSTQSLWINAKDAQQRGIKKGDEIMVFNERGKTIVPAKVTERIMPGVVALDEGAWYRPDKIGRDRGGNPNILTRDKRSPGGAFPSNTCLVQVERFREREM